MVDAFWVMVDRDVVAISLDGLVQNAEVLRVWAQDVLVVDPVTNAAAILGGDVFFFLVWIRC